MPISYFVDRPTPDPEQAKWTLLPADFAVRFVAHARRNKTFEMHPDAEHPGVFHMSGTDRKSRTLAATWSSHPAYAADGKAMIVFRDVSQDPSP